jgi:Dolichyl-phosphate-mannose-protein mannosyltransferase
MRTGSTASDWLLARRNHLTLLFLIFLYLSAVVVVNPTGNFPLNDDWSWAAAARNLALGHDWRPTDWTGMPLITQSLWAAPFCILTDCSYEALRASTLVAGLLLLIASYALFASVTKSTFAAGLAAATVTFNPVMFELTYTFMTDTFFAALLVITAFVFLKTFRSDSPYLFALACLLTVVLTLCRQVGLCIPITYLVVNLFRPGERARKVFRSLLPVVLCVLALVGFNNWMQQTGRLPALYYFESTRLINSFRYPILMLQILNLNFVVILLYLGLFCSPLLMLRRAPAYDGTSPLLRWAPSAAAAVAALVAIIYLWRQLGLMPVGVNILLPEGLGPLTLHDTWVLHLKNVPPLPTFFGSLSRR